MSNDYKGRRLRRREDGPKFRDPDAQTRDDHWDRKFLPASAVPGGLGRACLLPMRPLPAMREHTWWLLELNADREPVRRHGPYRVRCTDRRATKIVLELLEQARRTRPDGDFEIRDDAQLGASR